MALCAVVGFLLFHNHIEVALQLYLQFRTYVRPGTFDRLLVRQLVPPQVRAGAQFSAWGLILNPQKDLVAGKTGIFDDSSGARQATRS